jgi:ATP-dependent DNA helicase RecG
MVNKEELLKLMQDMESDRIERTTSFREDKLGEAVCAFSNDYPNHKKPGYLLLGVKDNGRIAGKRIEDKELQQLGNVRSNGNVLPQPSMIVSPVFHFAEGDVVVVEVHPSLVPPVRFKGKVFIRIGPRKAIANETEERRLSEKRASTMKTFDVRPCPEATVDDIHLDLFRTNYLPNAIDSETLAANHRELNQQLSSLRLYDSVHHCPTYAAIILFGLNPLYFIPGGYIQYIKLPGTELTPDIEYEKKFSGALVSELQMIEDFIRGNIIKSKTLRNGSMKEKAVTNYPLWALRELVMNAIMHRDYESNAPVYFYEFSDRIEIINPGGLYGEVRPENFPNASDYRNPVLGEAMKTLGYVNRFNFGIRNAQKALQDNGNPVAEFDISLTTKFSVVIRINKNWL